MIANAWYENYYLSLWVQLNHSYPVELKLTMRNDALCKMTQPATKPILVAKTRFDFFKKTFIINTEQKWRILVISD